MRRAASRRPQCTYNFLTTDPLSPLTRAPYNYANNNPTDTTDLTGLGGATTTIGGGPGGPGGGPPPGPPNFPIEPPPWPPWLGPALIAGGIWGIIQGLPPVLGNGDDGSGSSATPYEPPAPAAPSKPTPGHRRNITTAGGKTIRIPGDDVETPTKSRGGTVYRPPGNASNDDANAIRVMRPDVDYPKGYVVEYDEHGHPISHTGEFRRVVAITISPSRACSVGGDGTLSLDFDDDWRMRVGTIASAASYPSSFRSGSWGEVAASAR